MDRIQNDKTHNAIKQWSSLEIHASANSSCAYKVEAVYMHIPCIILIKGT